MRVAEVVTLIERIDAVRHGSNDIAAVRQGLAGVARLRGWLDGCEADLAAATIGRVPVPVETIAESAKISQRAADRVIERHGTATDVPSFGEALIDGDVSGGHVDALTAGIRSLEPAERHGFRQHAAGLVEQAKSSTVEEFRALVQAEARRFSADHGEERLARQKRACRLRSWVSPSDGMWKLSGSFDPQTGLTLHGRLSAAVSRLFHQSVPDDAPDDPGERADFLRAQALLALTAGSVAGAGAVAPRSSLSSISRRRARRAPRGRRLTQIRPWPRRATSRPSRRDRARPRRGVRVRGRSIRNRTRLNSTHRNPTSRTLVSPDRLRRSIPCARAPRWSTDLHRTHRHRTALRRSPQRPPGAHRSGRTGAIRIRVLRRH